jgi:hypothetical protein
MPTRAREVQMILQNKGMERGIVLLLQELFERQSVVEQSVSEMLSMQLKMADLIAQTVDGAVAMRQHIESMSKADDRARNDDASRTAGNG